MHFVTDSAFDHVGMVIKYETSSTDVFFIEACMNTGVALNQWSFLRDHVGAGKFYDKVVLRKVNYN